MSGILCSIAGATYSAAGRTAKTVTAVGNAQVDTAQSKFGGASYLGDGTNTNKLTVSNFTALGTGDFTLECFFRPNAGGGGNYARLIQFGDNNAGYLTICKETQNPMKIVVVIYTTTFVIPITSTNTFANDTFHHVALVRSSGTFTLYVNGANEGSSGAYTTYDVTGTNCYVGGNLALEDFDGHIDEVRVSNIARYTTTFTPSTTPFTNDTNTLLLIHADGTDAQTVFTDDVGVRSPKGISAIGNAQVDTAQSKFGGASALFDGTGDRLTISSQSDFAFGTGIFTIECWTRVSVTTTGSFWCNRKTATGIGGILYLDTDSKLKIFSNNIVSNPNGSALSTNTWYHIAVVRESNNNLKFYLDGTQYGSTITGFTQDMGTTDMPFYIGNNLLTNYGLNGYIDELRVSNSVRYTTTFTPSTTAFVNDANTLLLLHADGTDASTSFIDDVGVRSPSGISAVGNAQISTAQSKFGGSSILLDGTDDYLVVGQNNNFNFGTTGNFTIEFWIYFTSWTAPREVAVWEGRTGSGNGAELIFLYTATTLGWYVYKSNGTRTSTGVSPPMTANTWQHVALVRNGTNLQIYIDGTARGTPSTTDNFNYSHASYILIGVDEAFNRDGNGYIDEYRVSNIARYTGNFTPSSSAFVNDSNTVLLIHADGTDGLTRFTDDNA